VLYEVVENATAEWGELRDAYQEALRLFEGSEFTKAAAILGTLVTRYPNDWPTLLLLGRAVTHLTTPPVQFSPVLPLSEK
jgi:hypothetical protein